MNPANMPAEDEKYSKENSSAFNTDKWINIILAAIIFQYLHVLYTDIVTFNDTIRCVDCPFRMVNLLAYVDRIYEPFIIYLFYKRRRWGWILLLMSKLFTIIPTLIYYWHDYLPTAVSVIPFFLLMIAMHIIIVALLLRKDVANRFNISQKTKQLTIGVIALVLLLFLLRQIL